MIMRASLSKWGNSLAVRIPKDVAELAGFREGEALEMTLRNGHIILGKKRYDLKEMLKDMEGKDWGPLEFDDPPRGSEIW
jgi:antitoxin MazE